MTILAMAALLVVKSVALVRAAVPDAAARRDRERYAARIRFQRRDNARRACRGGRETICQSRPRRAAHRSLPVASAAAAGSAGQRQRTRRCCWICAIAARSWMRAKRALNSREGVLAAAEKRLGARVDELTALQERLEALETARHDRDDANWAAWSSSTKP